jgi:K+-transporting ATPase ATPase C chain
MLKDIRNEWWTAVRIFAVLTLLCGLIYPAVVTALAQVLCPWRANGSLLLQDGKIVGSQLIGQPLDDPKYFWGRLSATSPNPYNGASSSGSNLGPTNPALLDAVKGRLDALHKADPSQTAPPPVDLVTASGSGLDPDISPEAALYQEHRVAMARKLDEKTVRELISAHTAGRQWGLFGEPRVNVLELNLALDALKKE